MASATEVDPQAEIANAWRELRDTLETSDKSKKSAGVAKLFTLLAKVESAEDISPVVWESVDPEFRKAGFQFVLATVMQAMNQ